VEKERRAGAKWLVRLGPRRKRKKKMSKSNKMMKTPESKSSRASGLNFERLANLGLFRVRLSKAGLNFEIPSRAGGGGGA
jgi:hypothetical protein